MLSPQNKNPAPLGGDGVPNIVHFGWLDRSQRNPRIIESQALRCDGEFGSLVEIVHLADRLIDPRARFLIAEPMLATGLRERLIKATTAIGRKGFPDEPNQFVGWGSGR